jgi:hypothetical protein
MSDFSGRAKKLERALHDAAATLSVLTLAGRPGLEAAAGHFAAIEEHAKQLEALLQPGVGATPLLEGRELYGSLIAAIVSMARARRSGRYTAAELKDLVVNYCPKPDMGFWHAALAGRAVGLLRDYPDDVVKPIERQGVLVWRRWEDEGIRVVDTLWLTSHADIRRWITDPWPGGRRCRFCAMEESDRINALLPAEYARRPSGVAMVGDTVVLAAGGVTHPECAPFWLKWLEIAGSYASQEEAEAADTAAERAPRRTFPQDGMEADETVVPAPDAKPFPEAPPFWLNWRRS